MCAMKKLRLPVDVDPVSDARWSRWEREMFAKLDAPPAGTHAAPRSPATTHRLRWVGCATAVAAAAALAIAHPWRGVPSGERVRLATTDGASQFTVGESSLVVAPHSLVMVDGDDDHGIDVVLDRGGVTCEVAPRRGRPPFVIDSGDVHVRVVGTRFSVVRDAEGTSVKVDHGVVEVATHGVVTTLHDGDRWPERTSVNSSAPSAEPFGAAEVPPAAAGEHAPAQGLSSALAPGGAHSRAAGPGASSPPAASGVPTSAPPAPAGPSLQEVFESAARIERSRPDEAAAAYRQVALSATAWAPTALFALARLEAEHGHKAESARLLNEYLTRYPRGVNADDARSLLARAQ